MLCNQCSTLNPDTNRFCGECGRPLILVQQPVAVSHGGETQHEAAPPTFHENHQTTISGPSFLGLTDSSEDEDETNYLLDDDRPRGGHLGWFLFSAIAVAVLAVIGWMEWQAIRTGKLPVPGLPTTSAGPAPQQTPSAQAGETPNAAEAKTNEKPQSEGVDNEPAKSISADGTKDETPDLPAATTGKSDAKDASKSDAQATQESESRMAKEADARKQQEASNDSEDSDTAAVKPSAKAVSATTPKPPDPRKNQMLLNGEKYLYGRGVRQDCNQALIYFRAAAQDQNGPAMSHLGAMYASGHCVTANRVAAYKWFARAAEQEPSNQWISRSLNMLWRDMTPQERSSVAR